MKNLIIDLNQDITDQYLESSFSQIFNKKQISFIFDTLFEKENLFIQNFKNFIEKNYDGSELQNLQIRVSKYCCLSEEVYKVIGQFIQKQNNLGDLSIIIEQHCLIENNLSYLMDNVQSQSLKVLNLKIGKFNDINCQCYQSIKQYLLLNKHINQLAISINSQAIFNTNGLSLLSEGISQLEELEKFQLEFNCKCLGKEECESFVECLNQLKSIQTLKIKFEELDIQFLDMEQFCNALGGLVNLKKLELYGFTPKSESIELFSNNLRKLTRLEGLNISNMLRYVKEPDLKYYYNSLQTLENLKKMKSLFNFFDLKQFELKGLLRDSIGSLISLKKIDISFSLIFRNNKQSIEEVIQSLANLTNLQYLSIQLLTPLQEFQLREFGFSLKQLTQLKHLKFEYVHKRIKNITINQFYQSLPYLKELISLNLQIAVNESTSLNFLFENIGYLNKLQELNIVVRISKNNLDPNQFIQIGTCLEKLVLLKKLQLNLEKVQNNQGEQVEDILYGLSKLIELTHLDLCFQNLLVLNDDSLSDLFMKTMNQLTKLTSLTLTPFIQISEKSLIAYQQAFQQCYTLQTLIVNCLNQESLLAFDHLSSFSKSFKYLTSLQELIIKVNLKNIPQKEKDLVILNSEGLSFLTNLKTLEIQISLMFYLQYEIGIVFNSLLNLKQLETLVIEMSNLEMRDYEAGIFKEVMKTLQNLKCLKLKISLNDLSYQGIQDIQIGFKSLKKLKELSGDIQAPQSILQVLQDIVQLKSICIVNLKFTSKNKKFAMHEICVQKKEQDLLNNEIEEYQPKSLLSTFNLTADFMESDDSKNNFICMLPHLNSCNRLIELQISHSFSTMVDQGFIQLHKSLQDMKRLKVLDINYQSNKMISSEYLIDLSLGLKNAVNLNSFKIQIDQHQEIQDGSFDKVLGSLSKCNQLSELDIKITQNSILQEDFFLSIGKSINALDNLKKIKIEILSCKNIITQKVSHIFGDSLKNCKKLQILTLHFIEHNKKNNVDCQPNQERQLQQEQSFDGINLVRSFSYLKYLNSINLRFNQSNMSTKIVSHLIESIRECQYLLFISFEFYLNQIDSSYESDLCKLLEQHDKSIKVYTISDDDNYFDDHISTGGTISQIVAKLKFSKLGIYEQDLNSLRALINAKSLNLEIKTNRKYVTKILPELLNLKILRLDFDSKCNLSGMICQITETMKYLKSLEQLNLNLINVSSLSKVQILQVLKNVSELVNVKSIKLALILFSDITIPELIESLKTLKQSHSLISLNLDMSASFYFQQQIDFRYIKQFCIKNIKKLIHLSNKYY